MLFAPGSQPAEAARVLLKEASLFQGNLLPLAADDVSLNADPVRFSPDESLDVYTNNWQASAQVALGRAGMATGLFADAAQNAVKAVNLPQVDFFGWDVDGTIAEAAQEWLANPDSFDAKDVVNMATDIVIQAGLQLASKLADAVPIVGQCLGALVQIGGFVKRAIEDSKGKPVIYQRLGYDPVRDQRAYKQFAGLAGSTLSYANPSPLIVGDFTQLFAPIANPDGGVPGQRDFVVLHEDDGSIRVQQRLVSPFQSGNTGEATGGGGIPGTTNMHFAWDVLPNDRVQDAGNTVLPTLRQYIIWMWQGYISPVDPKAIQPTMYSVECDRLIGIWTNYLTYFRQFIEELEYRDDKKDLRNRLVAFYASQQFFGWAPRRIGTQKTSSRFGKFVEMPSNNDWLSNTVPIQAVQKLREQQKAALRGVMAAYVDERHPAIRNDPEVKAIWEQERQKLLQSSAWKLIDVSQIPPDFNSGGEFEDSWAFREAVLQKQKDLEGLPGGINLPGTQPPPGVPPGGLKPTPLAPLSLDTRVPPGRPVPPPPGLEESLRKLPKLTPPGASGGMLGVVAIGALAAIALTKKGE